ncbi:HK97-gp10 family putative phage morphogenesis protein [Paracoccus sulfuroxidans]|uniref:HK97 gp10 family phage protein n=1 Tax=Paracoccus sulfuroxidans TaxID=384678 RepID=A0A562NCH1_9RHOB|nr:HK97-gp10 family putative phage morphogenesis protein [Paracoccus sulfuroxidans]TWI29738.1 HK97 gp10 family phage protein [Paracoccus sulfuroxidans]
MAQLSPRIIAKLKQIPAVAVEAAAQAMEEEATKIVEQMRTAAPKGETLRLSESIGWTWGEVPAGSFTIAEVRSGRNKGEQYGTLRIKIYAGSREAYYARYHEFGTQKMAANPFFFPVWKKSKAGFRKRIRNAVKAAVKEELGNG